jgi:hypothetical protein
MYNAKLEIKERLNKKDEPYKVLIIHLVTPTGELIHLHEVYMKDALSDIMSYLDSLWSKDDE